MFKKFILANKNIIIFVFLSLVLLGGYFYFLHSVKMDGYQLFNVKKSLTWVQTQKSLFRTYVHESVDNYLLSEDSWREYTFSTQVINPQDCGFIYDYLDAKNYCFINFKNKDKAFFTGHFKDGKMMDLKVRGISINFPSLFTMKVDKQNDVVRLSIDEQVVLEIPAKNSAGKIALMLNNQGVPRTIFLQTKINGILATGQKITAEVGPRQENVSANAFKYLMPFYFIFVFFVILLTLGNFKIPQLRLFTNVQIKARFELFLPYLIHVFLAVCFFWPFIFDGQIAIFSYDNLGEIFPLFHYSQQNFLNILHGHAAWLWNPFIHNGFPFYSNHWDMIYYPFNWPVFLVAPAHLLTAVTFKSFLEVAALGMFSYGFFFAELQNKRWALFSSIVYQLCSFLIFSMGIFPATSTYFAMTFYLYLLWTLASRRALYNFLLLTFAVVLILTSANVAFVFYACLSLAILSLYRFSSVTQEGRKIFVLTACAWGLGTLISSVRIFSCLTGIMASNRMALDFNTLHDRAYMAIRLFLPEIAGWMGPDALNVLLSPNLRFIFRELELPSSNPQNCFFAYFGVLPALFLIASFLMATKGKHTFWKVYSLLALGIALLWQPLWGILSILFLPLNHYSYHMIILPVGICALIGFTGIAWEKGDFENKNFDRNLAIVLGLIFCMISVFLTYLFPVLAPGTRIIFIIIGFGAVIYYALREKSLWFSKNFLFFSNIIFNVLLFTILILVTLFLTLSPIPKKESLGFSLILPFLWTTAAAVLLCLNCCLSNRNKVIQGVILPLISAFFISWGLMYFGIGKQFLNLELSLRVYALDVGVGLVRLFLLVQLGLLALNGLRRKVFSVKIVFALIVVFTSMDLIVFNARFNNITAPFVFKNAFYPKDFTYTDFDSSLRKQMDLVNFRVHQQNLWDFNANKNLVFALPSYTGTVGYMTKRFSKFLTAFGYVKDIYMLYPEDSSSDARFLDLSAVRYTFQKDGKFVQRPSALGRLNFFYSQETIVDDDQTLARLKDPSFDPHTTVVLAEKPTTVSSGFGPAVFIPIINSQPNKITARINTKDAGYVLFAESFDEGWKAYVNGVLTPILRANYNFMACQVTGGGTYEISFVYDPPGYKRNLYLTLAGLGIFFFVLFFAILAGVKKLKVRAN